MLMDAIGLRRTWNEFFAAHEHTLVPSSSLIPTHPTAPLADGLRARQNH